MNETTTAIPKPRREQQALLEVGVTRVGRLVSGLLVSVFLATVTIVPSLDTVLSDSSEVIEVALAVAPDTLRAARDEGFLAANRALGDGIHRFERALEEQSFLRRLILPSTQSVLRSWFGVGNEQVYLGRDGWLFFRADFDHVTGPGFLEPRVIEHRRRHEQRVADPLPAILAFDRDLAARGIELIVMPTPVKPTVQPEFLAPGVGRDRLIHNPSYREFLDRLRAAGVTVFDPSDTLARAKASRKEPLYLRTDTHWSPATVELAARELASRLNAGVTWRLPPAETWSAAEQRSPAAAT